MFDVFHMFVLYLDYLRPIFNSFLISITLFVCFICDVLIM